MNIGDIDNYKQLVLIEHEMFYLIKFVDVNNKIKIIKFFKNEVDMKKMTELFELYIKLYNVNGYYRMIPIYMVGDNIDNFPTIFLDNDTKKISIKVKIAFLRIISNIMLDNYNNNKQKFLKNREIKEIKINAVFNANKFSFDGDIVSLTLDADSNMNIRKQDREFMASLIEEKCFGEKIVVNSFDEENKSYYIATCGDFKITFPKNYTYSVIMQIIHDHNNKIDETRKRR